MKKIKLLLATLFLLALSFVDSNDANAGYWPANASKSIMGDDGCIYAYYECQPSIFRFQCRAGQTDTRFVGC